MARNLAIVVGVNQYPQLDRPPLRYAEQDAIAMQNFLQNDAKFEEVHRFSDNSPPSENKSTKPIRNNLLMVLDKFATKRRMQESDSLWFFFSGHGARQAEQDYLLLSDSYLGNLQETAISTDRIIRSLRQCGAGNLILILDACRNRVRDAGKGIGSQTEELAKQEGVISLFSCSPDQISYEIEALQQGAFTYALLEALRGDFPASRTKVYQLDEHLQTRVPELNRQYNQQAQDPYFIAEPARRYNQILLPSNAAPTPPASTLQDTIDRLKSEAFNATYGVKDLDRAKRLWRQVNEIATNPEDQKLAVGRIEEIAQMQRNRESPSSSTSDSQAPQPPKVVDPPPVEPIYLREEIHQSPEPHLTTTSSSTRPREYKIPWLSILVLPTSLVLIYGVVGVLLAASSAPFGSWAVITTANLLLVGSVTVIAALAQAEGSAEGWAAIVAVGVVAGTGTGAWIATWDGAWTMSLAIALILFSITQFFLSNTHTDGARDTAIKVVSWAGIVAWAVARAWAMAVVVARARVESGIKSGISFSADPSEVVWNSFSADPSKVVWDEIWAVILAVVGAVAMSVAAIMAASVAVVMVGAVQELLKPFSRFHTFLILATTSWLGLGVGCGVHWVFYQHVSGR